MKQFAKMVLAGIVGIAIYDFVDDMATRTLKRKKCKQHTNYGSDYSPKSKNNQRIIGFKMQGEE